MPVSWDKVGEVLESTVAVTQPVLASKDWFENWTHAEPFHHEIALPPFKLQRVSVSEPKLLVAPSATS